MIYFSIFRCKEAYINVLKSCVSFFSSGEWNISYCQRETIKSIALCVEGLQRILIFRWLTGVNWLLITWFRVVKAKKHVVWLCLYHRSWWGCLVTLHLYLICLLLASLFRLQANTGLICVLMWSWVYWVIKWLCELTCA